MVMSFIQEKCKPLTKEEFREYFARYKNGDQEALEILVKGNNNLVHLVINRYFLPYCSRSRINVLYVEREDLEAIGVSALYRALIDFDETKDFAFSTFAIKYIHRDIIKALTYQTREKNQSMLNQVSLNAIFDGEDGSQMEWENNFPDESIDIMRDYEKKEEVVEFEKQKVSLYQAMSMLLDREQEIISRRYGLNGYKPHSVKETAEKMNLSRQMIYNIEAKVLRDLKEYLSTGSFTCQNKGYSISSIEEDNKILECVSNPLYDTITCEFSLIDKQVISLYLDGYSQKDIGNLYHCSQENIAARIKKLTKKIGASGNSRLYEELLEQRKQKVQDRKMQKRK